jgi:hypothetical protein
MRDLQWEMDLSNEEKESEDIILYYVHPQSRIQLFYSEQVRAHHPWAVGSQKGMRRWLELLLDIGQW